jgi:nucleoside-diphosphate-sugar epimerase
VVSSWERGYGPRYLLFVLPVLAAPYVPVVETILGEYCNGAARVSYGASKFLGEFLCLQFGRKTGVTTSVVRYHNIYGPRMGDKHVIPELIARLRGGEDPLTIYGAAESRAFC